MLEIVYVYEEHGTEIEVFQCNNCGRQQAHLSGADPACCLCEFKNG